MNGLYLGEQAGLLSVLRILSLHSFHDYQFKMGSYEECQGIMSYYEESSDLDYTEVRKQIPNFENFWEGSFNDISKIIKIKDFNDFPKKISSFCEFILKDECEINSFNTNCLKKLFKVGVESLPKDGKEALNLFAKVLRENFSEDKKFTTFSENKRLLLLWSTLREAQKNGLNIWQLKNVVAFGDEFWGKIKDIVLEKDLYLIKFNWVSNMTQNKTIREWENDEELRLTVIIQNTIASGAKLKWNRIAQRLYWDSRGVYFRTGNQCRERWNNHLNMKLKKSSWSADEDIRLLSLVLKIGTRWSIISKELGCRNEHSVKNRFVRYFNSFKLPHNNKPNIISTEVAVKIYETLEKLLMTRNEKEMSEISTVSSSGAEDPKTKLFYFIDEKVSIDLGTFPCICEAPVHCLGKTKSHGCEENRKNPLFSICNILLEKIFTKEFNTNINLQEFETEYQQIFS